MKTSQIKDILNQKRDACLSEEVIQFSLDGDLNENEVVVDKYTIKKQPFTNIDGEAEDIIHVKANKGKLEKLKIPHPHKKDGEYGNAVRVTVTNNETGLSSHHSVYQSGYSDQSKKPLMSVRSIGVPRAVSAEHADVIASHLGKKHVASWKKIGK